MVDQNSHENQNPAVPFEQPPVPDLTAETPQVATVPNVVLSSSEGGVPKWFYFIFGLTLIVFFAVTTLIVLSFTQKKSNSPAAVPTTIPTTVQEVVIPSITPIPEDPIISKFNEQSTSDEVSDIEADLSNTDLVELDNSLNELDSQMGVSP